MRAALWYAEHGFPVFPVHSAPNGRCSCEKSACKHPGKHPRTRHGFKEATTDRKQIGQWFQKWPDTNIAVPTGAASGLLIIDIDPRNGGVESWQSLIAKYGSPPSTAEQKSGGGGRHIAFADPGIPTPKELASGIDVKSAGGYIIVAPSIHPSGGRYVWDGVDGATALLKLAPAPAWLIECFAKKKLQDSHGTSQAGGKKWNPGERNNRLTSLAGKMRRGGMARESIEAALLEENRRRCNPPLEDAEVLKIAKSVAAYEPHKKSTHHNAPPQFRLTENAVLYVDSDPEKEPIKVCGPLEVAALTRDGKSEGWGRLLRWPDAEGRVHAWPMPMSLLAGDGNEYRSRLLDGGLVISPGRRVRDLLTTYIQTASTNVRMLCVSRIGWHGENFVLPTETIGPASAQQVIFQTPYESECLLDAAGTLDDWKKNVGQFCSGNSRLIFSASCAFAGSLLTPAGVESGGIHFVGKSSSGKSTILCAAGSILGGGRTGFVQSWRSTANGLEATASVHNDLTLFLDELSQLDAREASEVAYLLANGRGKSRMSRSIAPRATPTWHLLFVSAGEITLADHALTVGRKVRSGTEVRLLNIDADAGAGMGIFENIHGAASPDAFADQLKRAALRWYGTPLRTWLAFLTENRPQVERALKNFKTNFLSEHVPKGASGEVFRAAQRFALIAAAGEIATDAGITGWEPGEATTAAVRCLKSWIGRRGTTGASDAVVMLSQVRRFLEAHSSSRFQSICPPPGKGLHDRNDEAQVIRDRAGFLRRDPETDEIEYLILQEIFKSELCAGYDYRDVRKVLEDRGYLVREEPHWTVKPRHLPGMPSGTRVYCIRGKILEGVE